MNLKLALTVATLALMPVTAFAACGGKHQTTADCGPGEMRDANTGHCVKAVHS
jgi:hypothetical protein